MTTAIFNRVIRTIVLCLLAGVICPGQRGVPPARGSGFTLFGDVEVTGAEAAESNVKILLFDLALYTRSGVLIDRQKVANKGRYRFLNVPAGDYELVFEFENAEVARTQVKLIGQPTDVQHDVALEWRAAAAKTAKSDVVTPDDFYKRTPVNQDRFEKSQQAFDKKDYERAIRLLRQQLSDDPKDYQAWSELGTSYLAQNNLTDAEAAYRTAVENRPTFFKALLNLGRVRLLKKDFDGAAAALNEAIKSKPTSAEANYFLGEAYLQNKKGSLAVGYLNEALRLDPKGMAEVHLRLARLYDAVGMRDKAAAEYEAFLKKRPDYKDRKKLEDYILTNRGP